MHLKGRVGLGHKRLSIIDLSSGSQPIYNEDGSCCIVFNGEIYNYRLLMDFLLKRGHVFRTRSDTECILHLYEDYGANCVNHLRGMFAFAIWDERAQRLLLARDRVGKKPLFYALTGESLLFASEFKALLPDPSLRREVDPIALSDYLTYQYVPAPRTIFKDLFKLPPAHTLVYQNDSIQVRPYWELKYEPKLQLSEDEARERTLALLDESVKIRLESEVPLGCFLSGGIDSSAVVAFMRRHIAGDLKTFSIGFKEQEYNELPFARTVARAFDTHHEEFIVEPDAVGVLPKLVWHFDEPFGDNSALPTWYVAKMTRQFVTVALNGDGGDESFAGYERYRGLPKLRRYKTLPRPLRRVLQPLVSALYTAAPGVALFEKARYVNTISLLDEADLYAEFMIIFREYMKPLLLSADMRRATAGHRSLDYFYEFYHHRNAVRPLDRKMHSDIKTYLPGALLPKVDRTTMAHSLEGRSPFLDHELMQFAAQLPVSIKFGNATLKHLLKRSLAGILPPEILNRRKQGFGVPLRAWFRGNLNEYLKDHLLSREFAGRGWFNMNYVHKLLRDHERGRQNHGHRLWVLLVLELWARTFLDRSDPAAGPLG
ncbi:MAG: asparagine synthase (glutamine-hydrolyzing) [Candidatus Sumerlaeia bacterium]